MKNLNFISVRNLLVIPVLFSISLTFVLLSSCEKEIETATTEDTFMPVQEMKSGDPVLYFGHETFTREKGAPITEIIPITNPAFSSFDDQFVVNVQNGDGYENLVSRAVIKIDGTEIFGPSQFNRQITFISVDITGLMEDSELEVTLYGTPGAYIDLWIDGYLLWECGDPLVDSRDDKSYNTVLIGNQCWMAENLNYETANSWCYNDVPENCDTYGRLYNWIAVMNGEASSSASPSSVQGICPDGWHVPSDNEWKVLEGTVDTQYGVGDPIWDDYNYRGYDAGKRLKTVLGWYQNSGTDYFGFSAIPGGFQDNFGLSLQIGNLAYFWSATEQGNTLAFGRSLNYVSDQVSRYDDYKDYRFSLRCVKD